MKVIGFTTIVLILFSFTIAQLIQEKDLIIGTWIPEGSPNSNWEFKTDGKCYDYYEGNLENTYTWLIETTSPQCGQTVPVGKLFSYLVMTIVNNPEDKYCYEILSLDNEYLQMRWLERGGSLSYQKK